MMTLATGLTYATILVFAGLLVTAAVNDVRHYIIPNWLNLAVAASAILFLVAQALSPADMRVVDLSLASMLRAAGAVIVVFAACLALFAVGVMGGGDVKLIAACILWTGPALMMPFLFLTALSGGLVTLGVLVRARRQETEAQNIPAKNTEASPVVNPLSPTMHKAKVPYGVAIAIGGLYVASTLAAQVGQHV